MDAGNRATRSGLVGFLGLSYLFGGVGENQRFRAELDMLLVSLGVVGLWRLASTALRRATAAPDVSS